MTVIWGWNQIWGRRFCRGGWGSINTGAVGALRNSVYRILRGCSDGRWVAFLVPTGRRCYGHVGEWHAVPSSIADSIGMRMMLDLCTGMKRKTWRQNWIKKVTSQKHVNQLAFLCFCSKQQWLIGVGRGRPISWGILLVDEPVHVVSCAWKWREYLGWNSRLDWFYSLPGWRMYFFFSRRVVLAKTSWRSVFFHR